MNKNNPAPSDAAANGGNPVQVPAPAPVDPAKGNALLKKLFGSKLPIVQDPTPPVSPTQEK